MNEQDSNPPAVEFKDRGTSLIVFGILTMLLGGICALFVPLMIFGQVMAAKTSAAPANYQAVIPATAVYGLLAVALIWLGIGSIKARRWARALLLIFSWSWLVIGVVAIGFMMFLLPKMIEATQSAQPAGQPQAAAALKVAMVFMLLVLGVVFIALPAVWVWFYRSPHVKATCEARDPVTRWTDACPLPMLAVSLWLGFSAAMMLMMPLAYHGVLPCFGVFLSGVPGTLGYLVLASIWGWAARALYQLDVRGWWLIVVSFCVLTLSHVITYSHHDVMELYGLMGYPEQQMEQMKKFSFLTGGLMTWGSLVFMLPLLGYLIYVKKFFRRTK